MTYSRLMKLVSWLQKSHFLIAIGTTEKKSQGIHLNQTLFPTHECISEEPWQGWKPPTVIAYCWPVHAIRPGFIVSSAIHTHNIQAAMHFIFRYISVMCLPSARRRARGRLEDSGEKLFLLRRLRRPQQTSGKPCVHTWLMVFSICTRPRLGSVFLMKSTMVSRFSCCRIKGLWLPKRLKATLNMTSDPWRKIISRKTQKCRVKAWIALRSLFLASWSRKMGNISPSYKFCFLFKTLKFQTVVKAIWQMRIKNQ